ncbi:putative CC-NBS-LRR resistance protein, partial [Trifolium pratense]
MDLVLLSETIDEILEHIPSLETTSKSGIDVSKTNIEGLKKALQIIQPVLKNLHFQDNEALALLRNLKNAINDLTDLLEELSTDYALPQRSKLSFFKTINPHKDRLKAVNTKIKNVIEVVQQVTDELLKTKKTTTTFMPTPTPSQEAHEKIQDIELEPDTVGRQKEKKQIIDQLMPFHTNTWASDVVPIPVVTIVGFAGIGKKQLVRLICQDKEVKAHFGLITRVRDVESYEKCVSDNSLMNGKHYLVVMEDVETEIGEKDLKMLQVILAGGKSAILVTTSSKLVANNITAILRSNNNIATSFTSFRPHVLQELDERESWSLFWRIRGPSSIDIMGEIERKIVMDCGGIPLLIKFAAEFLNNRSDATATIDGDNLREEFLKKLKFEYYDKLTRLHKMCFAFCSLFPRDHLIDVKRLIHLLKAEGFLMDANNTTVEENLSRYFNDFLRKPIFTYIEEDMYGVVRKLRMQPLMHDLACLVSDQEENIKVDPEGEKVCEGVLRASFGFRFDVSRGIPPSLYEKAKKLKAILFWKKQTLLAKEVKMSSSICDKIIKYFKSTLRMLDLHDMGIKTLPASIGKMNSLRYLNLSFNSLEKLPSSITKLSNLQTLKLSQCYLLKELPTNIDELTNLNHLEIDGCLALTQMPRKIHKLNNSLQTLTSFVVSKGCHLGGLGDLAKLNNLRDHLEISHLEISGLNLSKNDDYLKGKKHLQHLTLRWDHEDGEEGDSSTRDMTTLECLEPHSELRAIFLVGYKGKTLSTWFCSMQSLVKLSLRDCTGCIYLPRDCTGCIYLPQLDQLPKLRFLELLRLDNLQYIVKENGGDNDIDKQGIEVYFPSLEELTILDCPNLKGWWENAKTGKQLPFFACLSKLHVYYCPKLISMPLFPGLDEELVLVGSSVKPLINSIVYSTRYNPFSKLKYMKISSIEESGSPPERWIKYFNSLEKLDIKDWKHLQSFPKGFGNLASLQSLNIENCQELDLDRSYNEWKGLKNLCSLIITENPKLSSLPFGVDK